VVRIAVVGAGNMGRNHMRVLGQLGDRAVVTAVVDPLASRGLRLDVPASGVLITPRLEDALALSDALVVAAPSRLHHAIAMQCLRAGKDVLVEKPLATDVADARELAATARRLGRVLQVGHIERFNPAVRQVQAILQGEDVIAAEAHRLSYFTPPAAYDNLVVDLMIHDLDIVLALFHGASLHRVTAVASPWGAANGYLHVQALLEFADGRSGSFTVSRLAHEKVRTLKLYSRERTVTLDYLTREVRVSRLGSASALSDGVHGYRVETHNEYLVASGEPLYFELAHFVDCVRQRCEPEVSGEDGVAALEASMRILAACSGAEAWDSVAVAADH